MGPLRPGESIRILTRSSVLQVLASGACFGLGFCDPQAYLMPPSRTPRASVHSMEFAGDACWRICVPGPTQWSGMCGGTRSPGLEIATVFDACRHGSTPWSGTLSDRLAAAATVRRFAIG